jgi:7,8-didemethyl-8-hydroxy-5-deazariboflavin synthase CofG subunit
MSSDRAHRRGSKGKLRVAPNTSLAARDARSIVAAALAADELPRAEAERLGASLHDSEVLDVLLEAAHESKCRSKGDVVTVSRNIFIPLTNLCRNRCGYCTFAKQPGTPDAHTYELDEVAEAVRGGVATGCIEALMCLGDKPEVAYRAHREWLAERSWQTTTDHLVEGCRVAFEGGMLPHTNAGILSREELERLRPYNASMGLMLETTSQRLRERDMPHFWAPDKEPSVRIEMHEVAGELRIPFTTGLLLGIGENVAERVDTLLVIRDLQRRYGHLQEVIVQPFHAKDDTRMRGVPSLSDDEVAGWVAIARLVLGSEMNIQAPPNLAPSVLERLLRSGLNDWGGVSPVTVDFINPEAPWPALTELRRRTEAAGQVLKERLPVYPDWIRAGGEWLDDRIRQALPRFADADGFALSKSPTRTGGVEAA